MQATPSARKRGLPGWSLPACVAFLALLPFVNRPLHMDDPAYVMMGQHILQDPLDFYGFTLNWMLFEEWVVLLNQSPPMQPFILAIAGGLFGWEALTMHLAMLPFAILPIVAAYQIARHFCKDARLASLMVAVSPVFLVPAAGVMLDLPLFTFYAWSIALWLKAIEQRSHRLFAAAGLLAGGAYLCKFFGATLIPLLALYTLWSGRRHWKMLLYLLIPIAVIGLYEIWTAHLYGQGHLAMTGEYAMAVRNELLPRHALYRPVTTIVFLGGCMAPLLFLTPVLWGGRVTGALAATAAVIAFISYRYFPGAFFGTAEFADFTRLPDRQYMISVTSHWWHHVQWAIFLIAGLQAPVLVLLELRRLKEPRIALLLAWLVGTYVFAVWFNHLMNARILLPLAVPLAILLMRRIERVRPEIGPRDFRPLAAGLALSLLLSLAICSADTANAYLSRRAAATVAEKTHGDTLWIASHAGLHHYAKMAGGKTVDWFVDTAKAGDWYLMHNNNWPPPYIPDAPFTNWTVIEETPSPWLTVSNYPAFTGFYGVMSPLPFSFGPAYPELYCLVQFTDDFTYATALPDATFRPIAEVSAKYGWLVDPSVAEGVFD